LADVDRAIMIKLVSCRHGRPDDSARRAARDVEARRFNRGRGQRESCRLVSQPQAVAAIIAKAAHGAALVAWARRRATQRGVGGCPKRI